METATDDQGSIKRVAKLRFGLIVAAIFWFAAIALGFNQFRRFESTPGVSGVTPAKWPAASIIHPTSGRATLVMMVHPQCSCTSASLSELANIIARSPGQVAAFVLFIQPAGTEQSWDKTATWNQARQIPDVSVLLDPEGTESTRFGAFTSGQVVLYDPTGHLQFSGGITAARGHAGDNVGSESVVARLTGNGAAPHEHAVFGCPLTAPSGGAR